MKAWNICIFLQACVLLLSAPAAFSEKPEEADGIFLVAKKKIEDPNFRETVVLVRPIAGGAIGVIINRPTDIPLSKLFPDHPILKENNNLVNFGGPVFPRSLVFMFRSNDQPRSALHMMGDVYLGLGIDLLERMLSNPQPQRELKIYAGHSGWGDGQLQNEIERGDWYVIPADASVVFDMEPQKIWPELVKKASMQSVKMDQPVLPGERIRTSGEAPSVNELTGIGEMRSKALTAAP